jgi:hypothetical protein
MGASKAWKHCCCCVQAINAISSMHPTSCSAADDFPCWLKRLKPGNSVGNRWAVERQRLAQTNQTLKDREAADLHL